MNNLVDERAKELGEYIVMTNSTVRAAAKKFAVSKSTVHTDVTKRLFEIDRDLFFRVRTILDQNKALRHIRGGLATKEKYEQLAKKRKSETK